MRLIDADALLEKMHAECDHVAATAHFNMQRTAVRIKHAWTKLLGQMPTIDAVEVVRCKDCKHWGTGYGGETEHVKVCEFANYMVGANGYCVYGERKMDAEVHDDA